MATAATLNETADKVIAGYNAWTIEAIMSMRSPDCKQQVLPLSLGRPAASNEDYKVWFASFPTLLRNWHLEELSRTVDVAARKVVFHARSSAESDVGPYRNEYMIILEMTEDGTQVKYIGEFVDTAASQAQIPKLMELAKKMEEEKR